MVVWSAGNDRTVRTSVAFQSPSLPLEAPAMVRDPRAWGFMHGIRRPRLPFDGDMP